MDFKKLAIFTFLKIFEFHRLINIKTIIDIAIKCCREQEYVLFLFLYDSGHKKLNTKSLDYKNGTKNL